MDDPCRVDKEALGEEVELGASGLRGPGTPAWGEGGQRREMREGRMTA